MTVKLGLVGTGTVGGGCIDILKNHREDFKRHYGIDVELVRVCSRNPEQAIAHGVEDIFTQDYQDILNDPDIDIVVELIGGTTVARDIVVALSRRARTWSRPTRRSWQRTAKRSWARPTRPARRSRSKPAWAAASPSSTR